MLYYDNGGASGTYTGFNIAELQMIPPVGYVIKTEIPSFSMNEPDTVHIASGDSSYYSPTGSNWSCQYAVCVGQSFTSTATDGSMSFAYGDGAIVADGWEVLITLIEKQKKTETVFFLVANFCFRIKCLASVINKC